ncbi:hypothetical protein ZWY2020_002963 [Hordeum vulgare]|nr:hypothetical protein ZWY2020_002963 [Hordeum vulgare]
MHKLTTAVASCTRSRRNAFALVTMSPVVRHKAYMLDMNAAVCSSASSADSVAVVVWFPYTNVVLVADPGSQNWESLHNGQNVTTRFFSAATPCLSVSASDLPSLSSNSIYFTLPQYSILVMSLGTGFSERLADSCQIHDNKERIRPSVRPFTIADHLITYCNPREWSKGLMFHEYHYIPQSFKELIKKIRAQKREMRIPRIFADSTHRCAFTLKEQMSCFTLLTE